MIWKSTAFCARIIGRLVAPPDKASLCGNTIVSGMEKVETARGKLKSSLVTPAQGACAHLM